MNIDDINDAYIDRLNDDSRTYLSVDTTLDESDYIDHRSYPKEYLNTVNISGMPVHSMILKIDYPIILLYNLDPSADLYNGIRLIITVFKTRIIEARILTGTHADDPAFIPRLILIMDSSSILSFKLRRR
jgi:ATP-dependent DNA helicase PIF1